MPPSNSCYMAQYEGDICQDDFITSMIHGIQTRCGTTTKGKVPLQRAGTCALTSTLLLLRLEDRVRSIREENDMKKRIFGSSPLAHGFWISSSPWATFALSYGPAGSEDTLFKRPGSLLKTGTNLVKFQRSILVVKNKKNRYFIHSQNFSVISCLSSPVSIRMHFYELSKNES
jgi:hypothetical protein